MAGEAHRTKGKLKSFLGYLTGDRRVEAEGEAEVKAGDEPGRAAVEREHEAIRQKYGETPDG